MQRAVGLRTGAAQQVPIPGRQDDLRPVSRSLLSTGYEGQDPRRDEVCGAPHAGPASDLDAVSLH